jgi:hypothetical protein
LNAEKRYRSLQGRDTGPFINGANNIANIEARPNWQNR